MEKYDVSVHGGKRNMDQDITTLELSQENHEKSLNEVLWSILKVYRNQLPLPAQNEHTFTKILQNWAKATDNYRWQSPNNRLIDDNTKNQAKYRFLLYIARLCPKVDFKWLFAHFLYPHNAAMLFTATWIVYQTIYILVTMVVYNLFTSTVAIHWHCVFKSTFYSFTYSVFSL